MKTHLSLLLVAFAASVANAMTTCRYDDIVTFMSDYFRGNDELPIAVRLGNNQLFSPSFEAVTNSPVTECCREEHQILTRKSPNIDEKVAKH